MIIGYPVIDLGYRPNNPSRCKDNIEAQGLAIAKTGTNTKNNMAANPSPVQSSSRHEEFCSSNLLTLNH